MATAKRKSRRRVHRARPGSVVVYSGGEATLFGATVDLRDEPVVVIAERRQRDHVQNRALQGLLVLLAEVLVLGVLAMMGVALHWFDPDFPVKVLVITVTPSFTAWLLVVRWAFRRGRAG